MVSLTNGGGDVGAQDLVPGERGHAADARDPHRAQRALLGQHRLGVEHPAGAEGTSRVRQAGSPKSHCKNKPNQIPQ